MKSRVLNSLHCEFSPDQMAEGLLRHDRGEEFDVESAGTRATMCDRKQSPL